MTCKDGITCQPPDGPHLRADQVVLCSGRLAIAGRRLAVGCSSGQLAVSSSGRCGAELVVVAGVLSKRREAVGT